MSAADLARRLALPAALAALMVALWFVYRPGFHGPFVLDDFANFHGSPRIVSSEPTPAGLLGAARGAPGHWSSRPLARISFALNYHLSGRSFEPWAFKVTNWTVHALNALLVYLLAALLAGARPGTADRDTTDTRRRACQVALVAAALWVLHPLHLTSVLYVVQRMTSMAATCVLLGLVLFVAGRLRLEEARRGGWTLMWTGLLAGATLGYLFKENAVLLAPLALVIEWGWLRGGRAGAATRIRLRWFYVVTVGVPAAILVVALATHPEFLVRRYADRDFTLAERLMTESRVLLLYLRLLVAPTLSTLSLHYDYLETSRGLLEPPSTALALAAWAAVLAALAWHVRRPAPWCFALAWFLVGHSIESTVLPLELGYEHRNYLPAVGVVFVAAHYVVALARRWSGSRWLLLGALAAYAGLLGFVTHARAEVWSDERLLFEYATTRHPDSYRSWVGRANAEFHDGADMRRVYASHREASRSNPDSILSLVAMARILNGLKPHGAPARADAAGPRPDALHADPIMSRPALDALYEEVTAEVGRRLDHVPLTAEVILALVKTQQCAAAGGPLCVPLIGDLVDWHRRVLGRISPAHVRYAPVAMSLAKLHGMRAETQAALRWIERAIEAAPDEDLYAFEKAMLLVANGRLEEAERMRDRLARDPHAQDAIFGARLRRLTRALHAARRAGESTS